MSRSKVREAGPRSLPARVWLWCILATAVLLRLVYFFELRRTPFFDHLLLDLAAYDAWGRKIAAGAWLGTGVFYQDPLYPYCLGILYALVGHNLTVVYLLQIILGTVTCYLVYRLGERLFSVPAAWVAVALAATYKPFIFYDVQIEKSFLAVFLVTGACLLLVRARERPRTSLWVMAGVGLGLLILIRGNYLLLFPLVLIGILFCDSGRSRGRAALRYALGTGIVLVLTFSHNYFLGDDWVITTSQAGQNFFTGNNPDNLTGMYRAPEFVRGDPKFEEVDFAREAERRTGRSLKPSEISNFWLRQGLAFWWDDPIRSLKLLARKTVLFWNNYEVPDNLDMYSFEPYSLVMRFWLPAFGLVAPFGFLGMILCVPDWRRLWPIYLFVVGYFASVMLFFIFSRYRLPVVPILMLFGAEAAVRLWGYWRAWNIRRLAIGLLILVTLAIGVNFRLGDTYNPSALDNLGALLLQTGDLEGAESLFRQVIARRPDFADARNNLAVTLLCKGDVAASLAELREVIRLKPKLPGGYVNLGNALLAQGDFPGAQENFRRALDLDNRSAEAWQGRAEIQRKQGDFVGAEDMLRRALQIAPESAGVHSNLAITLMAQGKHEPALVEWEEAIRLDPAPSRSFFNKGVCLERLHRVEEAIDAYRRAIDLAPGFAEAHGNLAGLLAEKGDRKGAVESYWRFLEHWKGEESTRKAVEEEIRKLK